MYAELQRLVEQSQAELVEAIATKQREAERHAQELARGLENELSQLRRRSSDLEAHAQMQDRVLFLQVLTSNARLRRRRRGDQEAPGSDPLFILPLQRRHQQTCLICI